MTPAFYTPPWNRIDRELASALHEVGFTKLSAWGAYGGREGYLDRIDAHVDLMRWNPRPKFRGQGRFYNDMTRQLRRRRQGGAWHEPIGLLTHHLDHDDEAWRFLVSFLDRTRQRVSWQRFDDLRFATAP